MEDYIKFTSIYQQHQSNWLQCKSIFINNLVSQVCHFIQIKNNKNYLSNFRIYFYNLWLICTIAF